MNKYLKFPETSFGPLETSVSTNLVIEKQLFGETIRLSDFGIVDTYPEDISPMFSWMQNLELPQKPTILDIGANVGMFSLSYASMFDDAEIHCFEPVPFIYNYLSQNLELNPNLSSKMHAHNLGLSNCVERNKLSIPVPQQHERYSKELDIRLYSVLGEGEEKFSAQFMPIDRWVDNFKIHSLDFIKIDVEGHEYSVLEGASKTLLSFRPLVMFELNQLTLALSYRTVDEYLRFATDHGYHVFGLEYGYKSELLAIDSVEQIGLVSDLILFPSS